MTVSVEPGSIVDRARRDERQRVRPARLAADRPASLAGSLLSRTLGRLEVGLGIVGDRPRRRSPAARRSRASSALGFGRLRDGLGPDRLALLVEQDDAEAARAALCRPLSVRFQIDDAVDRLPAALRSTSHQGSSDVVGVGRRLRLVVAAVGVAVDRQPGRAVEGGAALLRLAPAGDVLGPAEDLDLGQREDLLLARQLDPDVPAGRPATRPAA